MRSRLVRGITVGAVVVSLGLSVSACGGGRDITEDTAASETPRISKDAEKGAETSSPTPSEEKPADKGKILKVYQDPYDSVYAVADVQVTNRTETCELYEVVVAFYDDKGVRFGEGNADIEQFRKGDTAKQSATSDTEGKAKRAEIIDANCYDVEE